MAKEISVLFVPFGTQRIAATRYRVYQYLPYLREKGVKFCVFSIVSDAATRRMINSPNFKGIGKFIYYLQIIFEKLTRFGLLLFLARRYKILYLQRTTFPFGLEKILSLVNRNIIFDLDDAIFMSDRKDEGIFSRLKEYSKSKEVAGILKVSRLAIVENEYIRSYARQYCQDVFLIPGPIDTERYTVKYPQRKDKVIIGWIGSPSTTVYLKITDGILQRLTEKFASLEIRLIGAGRYNIDGVRIHNSDWSYNSEVSDLQGFDIGIMPMPDNEWTRGKLGCKMLQYMAVGVPAVVSFTPTNSEVIKDAENGFLVRTAEEWVSKLSALITNPELRRRIGLNGRNTVEEKFSVKVNAPVLERLLQDYFGE